MRTAFSMDGVKKVLGGDPLLMLLLFLCRDISVFLYARKKFNNRSSHAESPPFDLLRIFLLHPLSRRHLSSFRAVAVVGGMSLKLPSPPHPGVCVCVGNERVAHLAGSAPDKFAQN